MTLLYGSSPLLPGSPDRLRLPGPVFRGPGPSSVSVCDRLPAFRADDLPTVPSPYLRPGLVSMLPTSPDFTMSLSLALPNLWGQFMERHGPTGDDGMVIAGSFLASGIQGCLLPLGQDVWTVQDFHDLESEGPWSMLQPGPLEPGVMMDPTAQVMSMRPPAMLEGCRRAADVDSPIGQVPDAIDAVHERYN